MNTDTGQIYRTQEAIEAAQARNEPLAFVGPRVVRLVEAGRRAEQKAKRKRKMAKQSRRRNR